MKTKKWAVHVYTKIRIKVVGVVATNSEDAQGVALNALYNHGIVDLIDQPKLNVDIGHGMKVAEAHYAEASDNDYLIDRVLKDGQVSERESLWVISEEAQKAERLNLVIKLLEEIDAKYAVLSDIASEHGIKTLANLMYLQSAIADNGFIDVLPDVPEDLATKRLLQSMPSSKVWLKYVRYPDGKRIRIVKSNEK